MYMSNDYLFYKDKKKENDGGKPPKNELDFLKSDLQNIEDPTVKTKLRLMIKDLYKEV